MNNREWLYSLDVADLADWFDAEHVETKERVLDGDTDALNAKIAALEKKLRISWEYECKFQDERDELQAQVDELQAITDERWNKYIAEHLRADTLADDLLTANRQREQYRKLFGMALDWAHEITMLESSIDEGIA